MPSQQHGAEGSASDEAQRGSAERSDGHAEQWARLACANPVDNQVDKDVAYLRANGVSGVFSVTNELEVTRSEGKKK